jgi:glyoxylase I family protein
VAFQTDDLDTFLARIGDAVPISLVPLSFDHLSQDAQRVVDRSRWVIVEVSQGYRDESPSENAVPA